MSTRESTVQTPRVDQSDTPKPAPEHPNAEFTVSE
jgi:hypothetical protein